MSVKDYRVLLENLEYVKCDLCGDDNAELLFRKTGILTGESFKIVRCRNDGLVYVNPRISKAGVKLLYDDLYYRGKGFDSYVSYEGDLSQLSSRHSRENRAMAERIAQIGNLLGIGKGHRYLDVGCGNGQLLGFMSNLEFEAFGADVSPASCKLSRSQGLEVYCGEIQDDSLSHMVGTFGIVTAIEVLEHLHEPKACLERISSFLKPGGLFYYTTGNSDRLRIDGNEWSYLNPEGHVYYFDPRVMQIYFAKVGLNALSPYDYPSFNTISPASLRDRMDNAARLLFLRSKLLRLTLLRAYFQLRASACLMPLGQKPFE